MTFIVRSNNNLDLPQSSFSYLICEDEQTSWPFEGAFLLVEWLFEFAAEHALRVTTVV